MKKLKELLFLTSLNRVGKATIYKNYWDLLNNSDDFYDLVSEVEMKSKFSKDDIIEAMEKAEDLFDSIINESDIKVLTVFDEEYPKKLEIMGNKRPIILYVIGNLEALNKPNIAVIGTRKPSKPSEEFEEKLVKVIVNETERVVVSGLALGCDKIAHQTTLDEDKITVSILPSGLNNIKPAKNKRLAKDIIENGGCLVSEYKPNEDAKKHTYVQRDQIVAAFSDAILVVECGVNSGTMHTVDFAEEYGRQLFVYLPENKQGILYDGNEFILKNKKNSIKVDDIGQFSKDLENLNLKVMKSEQKQQTLKLSKNSPQTTFDF